MASNTRVQRTRSSPSAHRSPLTRCPLGGLGRPSLPALVWVLVAGLAAAQIRAGQPAPLTVTVRNFSGDMTGAGSWMAVVRDPGESTVNSGHDGATLITVPLARLAALRDAIASEKFFSLRKDYGWFVPDGPFMRIKVQLGTRTHEVTLASIKANMSKRESAEVDRAMRVWFAALDCLPTAGVAQ